MKLLAVSGTRYRATIRLGWIEGVASNAMVAERFTDVGLVDVQVFGDGRDRFADALWPGASQEVDLPEQITKVEVLT